MLLADAERFPRGRLHIGEVTPCEFVECQP